MVARLSPAEKAERAAVRAADRESRRSILDFSQAVLPANVADSDEEEDGVCHDPRGHLDPPPESVLSVRERSHRSHHHDLMGAVPKGDEVTGEIARMQVPGF